MKPYATLRRLGAREREVAQLVDRVLVAARLCDAGHRMQCTLHWYPSPRACEWMDDGLAAVLRWPSVAVMGRHGPSWTVMGHRSMAVVVRRVHQGPVVVGCNVM